jgi:hypothetical protein
MTGRGDKNYTPALQGFDSFELPKTHPGESNKRDGPGSIYFIHRGGSIGDSNKWRPLRGGGVGPGKGSAVNQMYIVSVDINDRKEIGSGMVKHDPTPYD